MAVKTQGTELYFIDPAGAVVTEVGCVTTITGLTAARDQIETTCLDSLARTYLPGMPTPGAATFTINADPTDTSHIRLHELYREGTSVDWAIGWSDDIGVAPTGDSSGFTLPTSRTWITFEGYIADYPFDFALNAVVTSNLSIQVSDFPVWVPATT
jgi:Phage tail tube, TTP, lambda-like